MTTTSDDQPGSVGDTTRPDVPMSPATPDDATDASRSVRGGNGSRAADDLAPLRTILDRDPADPKAAAAMVERLLAAGRVAEASDVLEAELAELARRAEAPPADEPGRRARRPSGAAKSDLVHRAERHRLAARLADERLGRVDRALWHWQQAWRLEPQRTDALDAARRIYQSLGDEGMVGRLYQAELEVFGERGNAPRRAAIHLELGTIAFRKGDARTAVDHLEQALRLEPDSIAAREALAEVYASPAFAAATADDTAQSATGARRASELFVDLGRRRMSERDDTTGIGFLRRALGADPYSRASSQALEEALADTARWEELDRVLKHREATAEDERDRIAILERRVALYEGPLADRGALIEALAALAALEPPHGPASQRLRRLLREEQRWDDLARRIELDIDALDADPRAQVTELLELATIAREHQNDKDRAAELLHRALAIDPASEEALARYAEHFRERRDWRGLADLYEFALDTARENGAPVSELVRRLEEIAQIAELRLGDAGRAMEAWQRISEVEANNPKAREALRRLGSRAKMWQQLVGVLEQEAQAAHTPAERADALRRIAQTYREQQVEPRRAIQLYEEVLEHRPDDDGALKALAELYEREGDDAGLAKTLRRQLELDARRLASQVGATAGQAPGARDWPVNRRVERLTMLRRLAAMYETRLSDADGVVYACGGILELLPGDRDALDRMERILEKAGDQQRLEQTLEYHAAAASGPAERARVLRRLARMVADHGDDARALELWEQTVKAVPNDVEALEAVATLYDHAQRWGELAAVLERLEAQRGAMPAAGSAASALRVRELERYARVVDDRLGDGPRAVKAWQRVLELQPKDRHALDALGRLHRAAGRWRELADVLAAQIPLHATDDPARATQIALERAKLCEERLGAPAEAVRQLEKILADLDPRSLDAHSGLRRLHEARGDFEAAVRIAEREMYLAEHPVQKVARGLEIGFLCRDRLGDPVRSLGAFQRVLGMEPDNDEALAAAAELHAQRGDWPAHVRLLEKRLAGAAGTRDRRALILKIASAVAERLGDAPAGFQWLRKAHAEAPDAATLGELRRAAEAFGLWRELAEVYADERTRLVASGGAPSDPAAYVVASRELAAVAERRLGDRARAMDALRDALEISPRDEALLAECERIAAEADDRPLWRALLGCYDTVLKRATPAQKVLLHEKRARILDERLADPRGAIAELLAAFSWAPERPEIRSELARLADRASAWPEVIAVDTALIERAPTDEARIALLRRKATVIEEKLDDLPRAFRTHLLTFFLAPEDAETSNQLWRLARGIGVYTEEEQSPRPEPPGVMIQPEQAHAAALRGAAPVPVEQVIAREEANLRVGDSTQPIELHEAGAGGAAARPAAGAPIEGSKKRQDATMELSVDDLKSLLVPTAQPKKPVRSDPTMELSVDDIQKMAVKTASMPALQRSSGGLPGVAPRPGDPARPSGATGQPTGPATGQAGQAGQPGKRPPPPPRRATPPSTPPPSPSAAARKAQATVRRTPLPSLPARTYATPWEELALACQILPAADGAARLRWLFRAAEIWENGAADVSRAFDTLARAMILSSQIPGGDIEARARLHRLAEAHGAWDRLADLYLDLADGSSTVAAAVDLMMEVAKIREEQGKPRDAEAQYRRILGMAPGEETARARLETLHRREGRWIELAASLEERTDPRLGIVAPEAERPALLRELASIYVDKLNHPHDAIDALERLRQLVPGDVAVLTGLGDLYAKVGRWSKVIEILSRVGDVADGTPAAREALRRVAEIYDQELELPERAMDAYAALVAQWPDDEPAYEALDRLYQQHAKWNDLAEVLRRRAALARDPARRAELLGRRAQILLEWLHQAEEAAAALRHARTILPESAALADQLVAALVAAKRGREAAAILEGRISRVTGSDAGARVTGSDAGARATGETASPQAAQGSGDVAALWIRLAQIRADELADVAGARAALEKAMTLVPDHPTALAQLSRLTHASDDPAAYVAAKLREADAVTDDDTRVAALMAAGEVLRDRLDDPARARGAFEFVLALRPYHADATWALAGLVEQGGDPDAAARLLETRLADEALPAEEKARVLTQLAALARAAGVEAVAERRLTEALAAAPRHVPAIVALADLYSDAERWEDLAVWLQDTIDDPAVGLAEAPGVAAELHRRLAAAHEKLGKDEEAYQTLLAADRLHRGNLLIKLALGENRYKARRWREAALHLGALAGHEDAVRYPAEVAQGIHHAALAEIRSLRPEKAPPLYARALELKPNFAPALQAMAEIAMEQGDHRRAADLLTRQASATEDPAERMRLFEALGDMSLMLLSDEDRARVCYEAAVAAAQPLEARHLPLLAKLLERQDLAGDHLGAARTSELMAAFGTTAAERAARYTRAASEYVTGGDRERARAAAERAVDADPYDLDAVTIAADLLVGDGALEKAATILGRALSSRPDGRPATATDDVTQARRATLWLRLGQVRLMRGDAKNGVPALEKAVAIAPDSDAALDARRKLLEVLRPTPGGVGGSGAMEPAKRDQAIELLRAIAHATGDRADVVAWADELRRADRPVARFAIELAHAMGHPLDVHQTAYLTTHKPTAMPADAAYKGAATADEVSALIADEDEAPLAPIASALAEAIALLVPDPEETLARVGAAGARRVTTAAKLAPAEMFPRIASAIGTGATVLYLRDDPEAGPIPDVQVVAAGTPMVVLGPRLRGVGGPAPASGELRFVLGRAAALAQPSRVIFAGAPREDAGRLLAAIVRSFGPPALVAAVARLIPDRGSEHAEGVQRQHDEHVRTTLPVRLRGQLQHLLASASPRDLDLDAFLAATERSADRAGLLASDEPAIAFAAVRARGADTFHLVRAALAPGWLALRNKLGWK